MATVWRSGRGLFFATTNAVVIAACGVDVTGVAVTEPAGDASAPGPGSTSGGPSDSSTVVDATTAADARTDDDSSVTPLDGGDAGDCPPIQPIPPGTGRRTAIITRAAVQPAGGDTASTHVFRGCPSFVLDASSAGRTKGSPKATATVYLEWDPAALWARFDVDDAEVIGTDSEPFENDSVELYVSSNAARSGTYGPTEHQYIVDYRGVSLHYAGQSLVSYNELAATLTSTGYRIVMRISVQGLGGSFSSGQALFVTALHSDSLNQIAYRIWAMDPDAPAGSMFPTSEPRLFSRVTLQ